MIISLTKHAEDRLITRTDLSKRNLRSITELKKQPKRLERNSILIDGIGLIMTEKEEPTVKLVPQTLDIENF